MKRYTTHVILAAAALAAAAGSASAQTLKAEIPFTFRAGGVVMAPGTYTVSRSNGLAATTFTVKNADSHRSAILARYIPTDASKEWRAQGTAKLGFECAGANCVLRTIWPASDGTAYRLPGAAPTGDEPARMAEVRLTPVKTN